MAKPDAADESKDKQRLKRRDRTAKTLTLAPKRSKKKAKTATRPNPSDLPEGGHAAVAAPAVAASSAAADGGVLLSAALPAERQLEFFLGCFQAASKMRLSPLELEAYSGDCIGELASGLDQDVRNLSEHVKTIFGASWKELLCEGKQTDNVESGSPTLLVISTSALRCLELLRGLKAFTKECRPAKLFAKHLKMEEQVELLKDHINIACGTPSRIKKLIDIDALSLSRLRVVLLDMQRDVKSFSLFTLPQVSKEFWDLYRTHLDQKVQRGGNSDGSSEARICFYGAVSEKEISKALSQFRS